MPDFTLELWKLAFEPHGNFRFEEIIDDAMVKWGLAPKMGACRSERLVSHEHPNLFHVNRAVGSLVGNALGYGTVIGETCDCQIGDGCKYRSSRDDRVTFAGK